MRNSFLLTTAALAALTLPACAQNTTTTTTTTTTVKRGTAKATTPPPLEAARRPVRPSVPPDSPIIVTVNKAPVVFDQAGPMMVRNSVLVPIRGVFEAIGGVIHWNQQTQAVSGESIGHNFRLQVGSRDALVNRRRARLNVAPRLVNGVTYVPLRFASEALGAYVEWKPAARTVVITTPPTATVVSPKPKM